MSDAADTSAAKLILVVDDDAVARNTLVSVLQESGYRTEEAPDGEVGLAKALEVKPDLILSDNLMPITNGTEMLERLRKDEWGASVPVILLTSQYSLEAMNDSLSGGSKTDFLIKDEASLDDVVAAVKQWLNA